MCVYISIFARSFLRILCVEPHNLTRTSQVQSCQSSCQLCVGTPPGQIWREKPLYTQCQSKAHSAQRALTKTSYIYK